MTGETTKRFLALDIGDLYFKFAFFEKKAQQLRAVLWGAEELSAIFWRRPLERIWPTIQQKYVSWKKEESSVEKVILTFSPSIFKAVLMPLGWERKNPQSEINKEEEQSIEKGAFHKTEEKMKEILFKSHGIAASDFVLQNLEILTMSIDGYRVSHLQGFKGTAIEFQFLGTFLPLEYAQRIQSLGQSEHDGLLAPRSPEPAARLQSRSRRSGSLLGHQLLRAAGGEHARERRPEYPHRSRPRVDRSLAGEVVRGRFRPFFAGARRGLQRAESCQLRGAIRSDRVHERGGDARGELGPHHLDDDDREADATGAEVSVLT